MPARIIYGDPGSITAMTVIVRRQWTYPASFMAVIATTTSGRADRREGIAFRRPDASSPWKLAIDTVFLPGADDRAVRAGPDGYALVPAESMRLDGIDPRGVYAAGLPEGSQLACYVVRTPITRGSWMIPQRVTSASEGVHPGYYSTVVGTDLGQACAVVPTYESGQETQVLSELNGMVVTAASSLPPPWLWIGLVGVALVGAGYALMATLGRMANVPIGPPGEIAPQPSVPPPPNPARQRKFSDLERNSLIGALVLVAIEAAILAEIARWVAAAHLEWALLMLVPAFLWIAVLTPRRFRRMDGRSTRLIPSTPDVVWALIADETNPTGWSPQVQSVEQVQGGAPGVGTVYRQLQRSEGGVVLEAEKVVTIYDPGRCYEVRYLKLWQRQTEHYTFTADPAGTRVTYEHELTMGPLTAIAGGILRRGAVRNHMQKQTADCLLRAARRLTGEAEMPATDAPATPRRRLTGLRLGVVVMTVTGLLSLGGYALVFGAIIGALTMAVLVIHELGHFAEARRHGLPVRLPFFIPFIGAAVTMRRLPSDAATHGRIALAGPLSGCLPVAAAFLLAGPTNAQGLLLFAQLGALLNLINLIPVGILDGGTILAPVSRWISVVGLFIAAGLVASLFEAHLFSPLVLVIAGLAVVAAVTRFRQHRTPYYRSVGRRALLVLGTVWLATGLYLCFAVAASFDGMLLS
jgi:Zn-dependent protease